MRRIAAILLGVLLIALLTVPVCAETQATKTGVFATVTTDGNCQVTLSATLHLEQMAGKLTFPVPKEAYAVTLNGSRVRTEKTEVAQLIDLSHMAGKIIGDISMNVTYSIDDVVEQTPTGPQVNIPMLSGFSYPIEDFEFSVTLPANISAKPAFSSGYHQSNIEKDLTWQINGPTVTGKALIALKDHETLTFSVVVPQEMFPNRNLAAPSMIFGHTAMAVCAGIAFLFWLVTMTSLPAWPAVQTAPPEGYSAGELKSLLTLRGADLTMMVFSWAQLGYVLIQMDRGGKVLLHKRMDMGNERGSFERRCFQNLFRKSTTIDTSTRQYALLQQKIASSTGELSALVRKGSGNPKIFRALAALIALFGGVCVGIALSKGAVLQWFFAIVFGIGGLASGWYIQGWAYQLFAMDRRPVRNSLILCGVWLFFGLLGGQFGLALLCCLSQLLAGLMAAFGGRRTPEGRQLMAHVFGLSRYLRRLSKEDLQRITRENPEYFHAIAPYALALGADRTLARHMGHLPLPGCSYLSAGGDESMTASQWSSLMRKTANRMEARSRDLPKERFWSIIRSLRH